VVVEEGVLEADGLTVEVGLAGVGAVGGDQAAVDAAEEVVVDVQARLRPRAVVLGNLEGAACRHRGGQQGRVARQVLALGLARPAAPVLPCPAAARPAASSTAAARPAGALLIAEQGGVVLGGGLGAGLGGLAEGVLRHGRLLLLVRALLVRRLLVRRALVGGR